MKALTETEVTALVQAAFGGNDTPSSITKLPQSGVPLKITGMKPDTWEIREDGEVKRSGDWVRVTFEDGGVLSLRGILQSPDLSWAEGLNTNTQRIKALTADGLALTFTHQESLISKSGNPYKRTHFAKASIGATPKK